MNTISLTELEPYEYRSSAALQSMLDNHSYITQEDRYEIEVILEDRGELFNA